MNEPEEMRQIEKRAQALSAEIAASMLRYRRARWILHPIYRLAKWVERTIDENLKEDGWR